MNALFRSTGEFVQQMQIQIHYLFLRIFVELLLEMFTVRLVKFRGVPRDSDPAKGQKALCEQDK